MPAQDPQDKDIEMRMPAQDPQDKNIEMRVALTSLPERLRIMGALKTDRQLQDSDFTDECDGSSGQSFDER